MRYRLKRLEKKIPAKELEIRVFLIDQETGTFDFEGVEYPLERYDEFVSKDDLRIIIEVEFV